MANGITRAIERPGGGRSLGRSAVAAILLAGLTGRAAAEPERHRGSIVRPATDRKADGLRLRVGENSWVEKINSGSLYFYADISGAIVNLSEAWSPDNMMPGVRGDDVVVSAYDGSTVILKGAYLLLRQNCMPVVKFVFASGAERSLNSIVTEASGSGSKTRPELPANQGSEIHVDRYYDVTDGTDIVATGPEDHFDIQGLSGSATIQDDWTNRNRIVALDVDSADVAMRVDAADLMIELGGGLTVRAKGFFATPLDLIRTDFAFRDADIAASDMMAALRRGGAFSPGGRGAGGHDAGLATGKGAGGSADDGSDPSDDPATPHAQAPTGAVPGAGRPANPGAGSEATASQTTGKPAGGRPGAGPSRR